MFCPHPEEHFESRSKVQDTASKENQLLVFVEELNVALAKHLDPKNHITSETKPELAVHIQEVLRNYIWSKGLEPFVKFYVPNILPGGGAEEIVAKIPTGMKIAMDWKNNAGTRLLIRRSLDGRIKVSLKELVSNIYNEKSSEFSSYRRTVKKNLQLMEDLGLWSFEEVPATADNRDSTKFEIEAGPTLKDFSRLVYLPWAIRQNRFFGSF